LLFPRSGISIPALRTRTEFALIITGLELDETIALSPAIRNIKKRIPAINMPVMTANVVLRKFFMYCDLSIMQRYIFPPPYNLQRIIKNVGGFTTPDTFV
jgi:hypothetical protein